MASARYGTFEDGEESCVWHVRCAPRDQTKHVPFIGQDLLTTGEHLPCSHCSEDVKVDMVLMAAAHTLRRLHEVDKEQGGLDPKVQEMMELLEAPVLRRIPDLWDIPTPQRPGGSFHW